MALTVAGQWKTEFVFDGLKRLRISRDYTWQSGAWVRTNETRRIYDGMLVIQERDSNNVPLVTYTRGLDMSLTLGSAGGIGGLLARTDTNGTAFYHADGAGNITALIDGNQNIVARYEFDAFGRLIGKWGTLADANVMRFSSMLIIRNSGIVGYWGRLYEPNLQRWINRDPIQERGGINLYRFVGNSPVDSVDPLGLLNADRYEEVLQQVYSTFPDGGWMAGPGGAPVHVPDAGAVDTDDGIFALAAPELPAVGKALGALGDLLGNLANDALDALGLGKPKVPKICPTKPKGLGNPFKGKSPEDLDQMFRDKGFQPRGPDPINGKGGYVNPETGSSYHIDDANSFGEPPHVDVNRPSDYNGPLDKKKYPY